jgi:hypothetical protein
MLGAATASRAAMQEHSRLANRIAAKLPVDLVSVAYIEHARLERLNCWVELCQRGFGI